MPLSFLLKTHHLRQKNLIHDLNHVVGLVKIGNGDHGLIPFGINDVVVTVDPFEAEVVPLDGFQPGSPRALCG